MNEALGIRLHAERRPDAFQGVAADRHMVDSVVNIPETINDGI
jgi:hypothetical protein